MISPEDKDLLMLADTPEEVCDHVRRASAAQKELAAN
jgi:predicted Rossmann-fold nucleotide-binding protein